MELIGGLAFLGNYINNRKEKEDIEATSADLKLENEDVDANNIYNRQIFTKAEKVYNSKGTERFNKSKNPKKTGVIPKYYNIKPTDSKKEKDYELFNGNVSSDSEFSDDEFSMSSCNSNNSGGSCGNDMTRILDRTDKLLDNRKHERKFVKKVKDSNNYLRQFDQLTYDNSGDPVSSNAVPGQFGQNSAMSRMENERELAINGGYSNFGETNDLTYDVASRQQLEQFTNTKLKPYFKKSNSGISREHQNNISQQKMELYTGSKTTGWEHKKEQTPLFDPINNITNIYGDPVNTDFYESRYQPSKERRNELPFQQIKVGPGIGLGANAQGGAFRQGADPFRILPKTIDQTRPPGREQVTYEGRMVDGQKGSNGPIIGKIEKRTPDTFVTKSGKDLIKTFSNVNAPAITGNMKPDRKSKTKRGVLREMRYGPLNNKIDQQTPDNLRSKNKQSHKETFEGDGPRNTYYVEGLRGRTAGQDETFVPPPTQRCQDNEYTGPVQVGSGKGQYFDPNDIPQQTMRNVHQEPDRTGNAVTGDKQKGQYFDPNDVPQQNMRNMHQEPDRTGNAVTGDKQKGQYYDPNDVPQQNMRNVHQEPDRTGNAVSGDKRKGQYYDPNDVPQQNMRNIHQEPDRTGNAVTGDKQKGQYYDPSDVPQQNMRNIHQEPDRNGTGLSGDKRKGQYYDPNDVPQQNMRNIHQEPDRTGNAVSGDKRKGQYYDPSDVPQQNMRNIHQEPDRNGTGLSGDKRKGQYYDPSDVPQQNMRNIHQEPDRTGNAVSGDKRKGQYYDPSDVPQQNMRNIHQEPDRTGNAVSGDKRKGQYYDPSDVPQQNMRNIHQEPDRNGTGLTGDKRKGQYYDPSDVPQQNMRNIHQEPDRNGTGLTGDKRKGQYYDPNDVPQQNMRNVHQEPDRTGNAVSGDKRKGQYYDPNDVPQQNMRNMHSETDRSGTGLTGNKRKGQYYDPNDVPQQNMRNIHSETDRSGSGLTGDKRKGQYFDPNDIPQQTMRNIHNYDDVGQITGDKRKGQYFDPNDIPQQTMRNIHNYDDIGPAKTEIDSSYTINYSDATPAPTMRNIHNYDDIGNLKSVIDSSYTINYGDATPALTQREITGETNYVSPANDKNIKPRNRRDAYNAQLNVIKELSQIGRTPTLVGRNKGHTIDFTNFEFKNDDDELSREFAPIQPIPLSGRSVINFAKNRNETWFPNTRINCYPSDVLEGNPYVNNQVHKAVSYN